MPPRRCPRISSTGTSPAASARSGHPGPRPGRGWVWLSRWLGESPTAFPDWDVSTHPRLLERWREIEGRQKQFLDGLDESDLDRVVTYKVFSGKTFSNPLAELFRHVVNHATYHRGQVATMLRQLGLKPPQTDLILYYRERG
jgi:uncharacterized damage-inducible protein DinB